MPMRSRAMPSPSTPDCVRVNKRASWPLQDIRSLVFVCARINHIPLLPRPFRITHTTTILVCDFRVIYTPPRPSLYMPCTMQYW